MRSLYDLSRHELSEEFLKGEPPFRLEQVWTGLYEHLKVPEDFSNVPEAIRRSLTDEAPTALTPSSRVRTDDGQTIKYLWELPGRDGRAPTYIESVLMHYPQRSTVCISTQAGCAMACEFCATGQAGFDRQLSVGEMVEQVVRAARESLPRRVSNIVFMGMGEPMANYDNVWSTVERLHRAMGLSARHLTISTVGLIPGIDRLSEEEIPVNLAVSLHAGNDDLRNELVPINRRYPLADLVDSCQRYFRRTRRRVSLEWALIHGVNDRDSDADELAAIARRVRAHVNLIPLNPTPGYPVSGTPPDGVLRFHGRLRQAGVNATVRDTRGSDIDAACGQLRAEKRVEMRPHQGRAAQRELGDGPRPPR